MLITSSLSHPSRFSRIFISVLSFSVIPVLILNLIFNYLTYRHARENYLLSVNDSLVSHALGVDEKIRGLENLISVIGRNPDVISFVIDPSLEDYQQHARITDLFASFVGSYDFVSSIYLYSAGEGIILASNSGVSRVNVFYDTAWIDQFNRHFLGRNRLPTRIVTDSNGKISSLITILSNLPIGTWGKTAGLAINLNTEVLFSNFSAGSGSAGSLQVINVDGYILDHPELERIGNFVGNEAVFRTAASRDKGFFVHEESNTRHIVSFYTAPHTRWVFTYESDVDELIAFARGMLFVNLVIIILTLFLLLLIGLRVSRRLYYPLEQLGNSSEILEYARPVIREHTLYRLVFNRESEEADHQNMLHLCGLSVPEGRFRPLVFLIDGYSKLRRTLDPVSLRLVKDAMHKRIRARFPAESLWLSGLTEADTLCCLLKDDTDDDFYLDCAGDVVALVRRDFPFTVSCGIGKSCDSLGMLHLSYRQARGAVEQRFISGYASVHQYDDARGFTQKLSPAMECERNLIACVKSGNSGDIKFLLDSLLQLFTVCPGMETGLCRWILEETVYSLMEIQERNLLSSGEPGQSLFEEFREKETLEEVREWLLSVCRDTAALVQAEKTDKTAPNAKRIADYLDHNLDKPEVSLIDIGDAVGLSPSYVSRIFKEYFGTNYIDYLNRSRVEKAKAYLLDPDIPVGEVALRTGFSSLQTFIRVFKKYERIPPGKFRKLEAAKKEALS
jgi:two-component system, response regulator YesN